MRVKLKCPNPKCATPLTLDTDWAGKTGTCSNCEKKFKIPSNLAQLAAQSGVAEDKTIDGALTQNASNSDDDSVIDAEPIEDAPRPKKKATNSPARKKAAKKKKVVKKKAAKKKATRKKATRKKATRKKATRRPAVDTDLEFIDDDEYEDYDDYDEADDGYEDYDDGYDDYDDAPRGRRAGGGGRRKPSRSRRDDYDDDYDDYEDDYDDYDDSYSRKGRSRSKRGGGNSSLIGVAVLILAIAFCVRGAGGALVLIGTLIGDMSSSSVSFALTMIKISKWLAFLSYLGALGGSVVGIIAPSKGSSRAFAIACVSVASISTILYFSLAVLPMLDSRVSITSLFFGMDFMRGSSAFIAVSKQFFLSVSYLTPMGLFFFYLKQTNRNASLAPFFVFLGWVGTKTAQSIFFLIISNSRPSSPSRAPYYIIRTLHWAEILALVAFMAVGAVTLFKNRR